MTLGLVAGAVTSMGFIPQLIRGYRTKELDDVSYFMPSILAIGMSLWFLYGFFVQQFPIIVANALLYCFVGYEKDLFLRFLCSCVLVQVW